MKEGQQYLSTAPLDNLVHPTPSLPSIFPALFPFSLLTVLAIEGLLRGKETGCVLLATRLLGLKPLLEGRPILQFSSPRHQLRHQLLISVLHRYQMLSLFQSLVLSNPHSLFQYLFSFQPKNLLLQ